MSTNTESSMKKIHASNDCATHENSSYKRTFSSTQTNDNAQDFSKRQRNSLASDRNEFDATHHGIRYGSFFFSPIYNLNISTAAVTLFKVHDPVISLSSSLSYPLISMENDHIQKLVQRQSISVLNLQSYVAVCEPGIHVDSIHVPLNPSNLSSSVQSAAIQWSEYDGKMSILDPIIATNIEDRQTCISLQNACKQDNVERIRSILKCYPCSARLVLNEPGGARNTVLHFAAELGHSESINAICDADPQATLIRNNFGCVPLHIAVQEGHFNAVLSLCNAFQESSRMQCFEGNLPLHDNMNRGSKFPDAPQIATILLQCFKEAMFVPSEDALLPIHYAATNGFVAGIRTLLSVEFDTIYQRDSLDNMLPLDLAVCGFSELTDAANKSLIQSYKESIELLLSSMTYRRLISPRDNDNDRYCDYLFLPLHSAITARPTLDTWTSLLQLYGNDHMHDEDEFGRNVGHALCSINVPDEGDLQILNDLDHDLFTRRDKFGCLPLHLSLQHMRTSFTAINAIVSRNFGALESVVKDCESSQFVNFLPFQIAAATDCDLSIIFSLIVGYPGGIE